MYRRSADIESINSTLAALLPSAVTRIPLHPSREDRPISAIRLRAGDAENRRGVLLVGGIHARELLNPDLLVDMAVDLLVHYLNGTDWVMGEQRWTSETIKLIMETLDVFILPNANPDGREYVLDTDRMWRKNRAPLAGTSCVGVDLNRNCDLLWGIETVQGFSKRTSLSQCSDLFVGPGAFSEPETQNVRNLLNDYEIRCFVDVHSFSELILHPWGHAHNQTTDSSQRFTLVDTSGWGELPTDAPDYQEYIPPRDLERFERVGQTAADAIRNVRGRTYTVQTGRALYATTGTTSDYAYSRHIADDSKRKVYGFTFETGPYTGDNVESFQPEEPEQSRIAEEATSGLISVIGQCICAIELIGSDLFDEDDEDESAASSLTAMRAVRDERLAVTDAGREWIAMLSRHQLELASLALRDKRFRKEGDEVIRKVGAVLRKNKKFSEDLAARLRTLIGRLAESKISEGLREDLALVERLVEPATGKRVDEIVCYIAFVSPASLKRSPQAE